MSDERERSCEERMNRLTGGLRDGSNQNRSH